MFAHAPAWLYASVMGLVQGLTEFLPVSSSGHLSLVNLLFAKSADAGLNFTFFLHIATLLAALIYFRRDIARLITAWLPANRHRQAAERRITVFLIIGCLITGPMGLLLESKLAFIADNLRLLGAAFLLTTTALIAAEWLARRLPARQPDTLGPARAALVGFLQGCAVIPGFSRSGATIAAGMFAGLSREDATRYSFLLGIPIIIAGAAKDGLDLMRGKLVLPPFAVSALGFVVAAIAGYIAIIGMIKLVQRTTLTAFAAYTALLGVILIVLSFVH